MRGEHGTVWLLCGWLWGSSPHARGTPPRMITISTRRGIIPACAGNTPCVISRICVMRDHPRMRGEHLGRMNVAMCGQGSSPHARGTLALRGGLRHLAGIIPACAGNTRFASLAYWVPRDHPRMRGEHVGLWCADDTIRGSSPHARGTLDVECGGQRLHGIIPACAGNTRQPAGTTPRSWDHPRMRGEHTPVGWKDAEPLGSSPHARGTQPIPYERYRHGGIIPACAGNTCRGSSPKGAERDHPRMRGEHIYAVPRLPDGLGSSPHARGTLCVMRRNLSRSGIIPACAGNTPRFYRCARIARDHPRMRGEHRFMSANCMLCRGSSPHARGTLRADR